MNRTIPISFDELGEIVLPVLQQRYNIKPESGARLCVRWTGEHFEFSLVWEEDDPFQRAADEFLQDEGHLNILRELAKR